jgi:hypothetical protein
MDAFIDTPALHELATGDALVTTPCGCLARDLSGWSNWPVGYREEHFERLGSLARHSPDEATLDEYDPADTGYWSPAAPIAPRFYPCNQATVWRCMACSRVYLRHNDDGAYHVAPRIRRLQGALIVDAPHAHDGREARGASLSSPGRP